MPDSDATGVPRQPEEPTPEQVLEEMNPCEPYTAGELTEIFEEELDDVSRWTIQRRLDDLHEEGRIRKKKHSARRVSYWIDLGGGADE